MTTPSLLVLIMHGSGRYYAEPLLAAGRLPRVGQLVADGHHRYFRSELPLAAGAWVTLLTGQSVGHHGVLDYVDLDARHYDGLAGRHAHSADYADRTVLSVLSKIGRRVASIYLPMTSPPWPVHGMLISGFPLADERRPPTFPTELAASLPPFAPSRLLTLQRTDHARVDEYLRDNLDCVERVTRTACAEPYDVVFSCIPTPDIAHHYFWQPDDDGALERVYRYYDLVDAAIGRIVDSVDDATTVVVLSDHGGRAAPERLFGVNRWLADTGYLTSRRSSLARPQAIAVANRIVDWAKQVRLNHYLAPAITGALRRRVSSVTHNTAFVDWSRTRAYGLDFICPLTGVEINLKGRQKAGIVPPDDYEPLRREIIDRLSNLRDGATGRRVFDDVATRETFFHGPHLDRFPDVIGILTDEYDVKGQLDLPITGHNGGQYDYPFMGYHGRDAFFAARGPGIPRGVGPDDAPMIDVAPTLLALAGVPVPSWMEGRPFEF